MKRLKFEVTIDVSDEWSGPPAECAREIISRAHAGPSKIDGAKWLAVSPYQVGDTVEFWEDDSQTTVNSKKALGFPS